jgi:hypothetical protein
LVMRNLGLNSAIYQWLIQICLTNDSNMGSTTALLLLHNACSNPFSKLITPFRMGYLVGILYHLGISRSSSHKRRATGGHRPDYRKKRKFELGRQAASTKLGAKRIHTVRTRGGNEKFRALRLDGGQLVHQSSARDLPLI